MAKKLAASTRTVKVSITLPAPLYDKVRELAAPDSTVSASIAGVLEDYFDYDDLLNPQINAGHPMFARYAAYAAATDRSVEEVITEVLSDYITVVTDVLPESEAFDA